MIIAIETYRFWLEFQCQGGYDHDTINLEIRAMDLRPESREILQQIFKGGLWIGMNEPDSSHSVNIMVNKGELFQNFRWHEIETRETFKVKGTYENHS